MQKWDRRERMRNPPTIFVRLHAREALQDMETMEAFANTPWENYWDNHVLWVGWAESCPITEIRRIVGKEDMVKGFLGELGAEAGEGAEEYSGAVLRTGTYMYYRSTWVKIVILSLK